MGELRFLSANDVEAVGLKPEECVSIVRDTLREHAEGALEMPPKSGVHPPQGRHVHAMSAFLPRSGALGLKWIADFPRNPQAGLPTLSAVIILNDSCTGVPLCIMEGGKITAARTAAMTAVSLLACARAESAVAAIVGTGVQARAHARMLPAVFPNLDEIRIAGVDVERASEFCCNSGSPLFRPANSRQAAVEGADIVVTLTNSVHDPLLEPEWLKPGITAVVLDNGGKETRILRFVDRILVDDRRPFGGEEVRHRFPTGVPALDAEIGEVLIGKVPGRRSDTERILILNLGMAACDISVAAEVYRRAVRMDIGARLRLC